MEEILKAYSELIEVYNEQIRHLEEIRNSDKRYEFNPVSVLNSRMFTYDEYLLNPFYGGGCYEEKNVVMPYVEKFFAHYENLSSEEKEEFESRKIKEGLKCSLDPLIKEKSPIIEFLKSQLAELERLRYDQKMPFPPKRKNATQQKAKYLKDRKEYDEQMKSIQNCKEEVQSRIERIEKMKKEVVG